MYIYVILSILLAIYVTVVFVSKLAPVEHFNSFKEPDWEALERYCEATGRNYEAYRQSVVTDRYSNEARWVYEVVRNTECEWAAEVPHWSLAITNGSVEYGYAFTMGHTMYLPISYVQSLDDTANKELVFHELRHIWQRQNYEKFIHTALDPVVWRDWKCKVIQDPKKAVQKMKAECRGDVVINPDTFQVLSYYKDSKHPMYPLKQSSGLEYIIQNHTQKITWNDPHPCEWDAREAAQNILLQK